MQRTAGLTPDEVEALKKEAEEFAEQDRIERDRISTRVSAEAACAEAERNITKYGDKVDAAVVDKVRRSIENVKESLTKDDTVELKSQVAGLNVALWDLGRAIHTSGSASREKPKKRPLADSSPPIELGEGKESKPKESLSANPD